MKRAVVQTGGFSRLLDLYLRGGKLARDDYSKFEWLIVNDPRLGAVIQGTGGLRKVRLQARDRGKRGSFRVIYLDIPEVEKLYLIAIYPKNVKEGLSPHEKERFKELVAKIKREAKK